MSNRQNLAGLSLILLAACSSAKPQPATTTPVDAPSTTTQAKPQPKLGSFGVDLTGIDRSVKPGDDFYQFAGGGWLKANQIPADRSRWGMFDELREQSDVNVRAILDEEAAKKPAKGTNLQKATDFYSSYLDQKAIDAKGLAPIQPALATIDGAKSLTDIATLMGRPDLPTHSPILADIDLDEKDPDRYVVRITQSGLGLPEREYYLKTEAQFTEIRAKYEEHIAKVLELAGDKKAKQNAKIIVALETKLATAHWEIAERREREKTYNPRTLAELEKEAKAFPWKAYLGALGYTGEASFVVGEITAIPKLAQIFAATPVATWKAYLTYHALRSSADVLTTTLDDEVFEFYGRTLYGQPQKRDRWKRAVTVTNNSLGEAVGELYVARHFQPKAKAAMDTLVENLRRAYRARIENGDWMSAETKKVALEKLASFRPKIGYPAKWKSYDSLEVKAGDAFGNAQRASVWQHEYDRARLGRPTDKDEWFMTPQMVNAYYNPVFNEIVFPAAILQAPFFDADADPAVNYGGIGGVIGHEMGHGFDDQGAKSDAKGVLRTWWNQADIDAFKKRTDALADQYAAFEPLPGLKVNGRLTLGENIGDLGGLTVAHAAYQLSLEGKPAEVLESYTGDQRFFFGWAQVWRTAYREQALRNQVLTDPHSPPMYRVNGVVRNLDAWYQAFDIKPDNALFLAPEKRVTIW